MEIPEAETDEVAKFNKSLLELKDLCSQLHHAANYCEATFSNATKKKAVVENTKEYLCRAVVTVVDHLGSVSANLECRLSQTNAFSETELRIDSLKQRLLTCQQYSHKLSLRRHCWHPDFPRHYSRYISPPANKDLNINKCSRGPGEPTTASATSETVQFEEADEEVPLFLYTYNIKPSLFENSKSGNTSEKKFTSMSPVMPVRSGLSTVPNPQHRCFQFQDSPRLKNRMLGRKYIKVQNKDLMSLVRRGKRVMT